MVRYYYVSSIKEKWVCKELKNRLLTAIRVLKIIKEKKRNMFFIIVQQIFKVKYNAIDSNVAFSYIHMYQYTLFFFNLISSVLKLKCNCTILSLHFFSPNSFHVPVHPLKFIASLKIYVLLLHKHINITRWFGLLLLVCIWIQGWPFGIRLLIKWLIIREDFFSLQPSWFFCLSLSGVRLHEVPPSTLFESLGS